MSIPKIKEAAACVVFILLKRKIYKTKRKISIMWVKGWITKRD